MNYVTIEKAQNGYVIRKDGKVELIARNIQKALGAVENHFEPENSVDGLEGKF